MDVSEYWDQLADFYQVKNSTTDWLLGYPVALTLFGNLSGKTLLDYGCGNGAFARFVLKNQPQARVIGVDTSESAIAHAHEKTQATEAIEYHQITNYVEMKQFTFDAACANFLFCIIPNIDTLIGIAKCVYAQLPVGASFVVVDPHPETHGKKFTSFQSEPAGHLTSGDRVHVRLFTESIDLEFDDYYWTRADYEHILQSAGFKTIRTEEPTAAHTNEQHLGAEKEFPPFIIFQATK
jgi:SAM-dependent methyltransferase